MLAIDKVLPPQRSSSWTQERVDRLSKQEIQSLRANADSLGAAEVIALCDEALQVGEMEQAGTTLSDEFCRIHRVTRDRE